MCSHPQRYSTPRFRNALLRERCGPAVLQKSVSSGENLDVMGRLDPSTHHIDWSQQSALQRIALTRSLQKSLFHVLCFDIFGPRFSTSIHVLVQTLLELISLSQKTSLSCLRLHKGFTRTKSNSSFRYLDGKGGRNNQEDLRPQRACFSRQGKKKKIVTKCFLLPCPISRPRSFFKLLVSPLIEKCMAQLVRL